MQYLRRFLWYIAKRLLGVTLLFGALIIAFYMAMNTSNILILLKDGMALRAQVIMMEEEPASLTKFFQEDFVRLDTALNVGLSSESPYADYDITGIDHRVTLEWMWCWPWDDTASADFVESVPKIDGASSPACAPKPKQTIRPASIRRPGAPRATALRSCAKTGGGKSPRSS